jgi:hypothetical protein
VVGETSVVVFWLVAGSVVTGVVVSELAVVVSDELLGDVSLTAGSV